MLQRIDINAGEQAERHGADVAVPERASRLGSLTPAAQRRFPRHAGPHGPGDR
jgi:hypothetical protein